MSAFGVAFRQLMILFNDIEEESISCVCGAGIAKSRWAGTPSYAKTTDLSGSIISSPVPEKSDTVFITLADAEENIDR